MKTFKPFLAFIALGLLAGCQSTTETGVSMARFESPEINSDPFHFRATVGTDTSKIIAKDTSESTSTSTAITTSMSMTLGYSTELTVGAGIGGDHDYEKYAIKHQFYGSPLESAVEKNFSMAVSLGYIRSEDAGYGTLLAGNYDDDTYDWDLSHDTYDIALISGYRLSSKALLYGSIFYQKGTIDVDYTQMYYRTEEGDVFLSGACSDTPEQCLDFSADYDGHNAGVSIALEYAFTHWFAITGEAVYKSMNWFDRSESETAANVNFEFRF
ncbi:hypothetical protein [Pseudoalteromonas shioyasakiensis]|uniref:hypothetical protein n=1 Tax=Pseudoalteromonas shioyasakiensis TaxID=1190813 RepID=UPI002551F015|nr:hypothetical protein [Pseudoalteromonas shioyasakiensis]MDK9682297.1 hypothetical protein [Pseudoalteromonas shioyasakiensis]